MTQTIGKSISQKLRSPLPWFLHLSKKKKALVIVGIVALFIVYKNTIGKTIPVYQFDTVSNSTVTEVVTETGNVASSGKVNVTSPSTGMLSEIYVKNGDGVSANDNLFKVVSSASQQDKAAAYAAYLQAKSQNDAASASLYSLQSTMYANWKTYMDLSTNGTYQNGDGSPNITNRTLPAFTTVQDNWLASEASYKNQQSVIAQTQAALNSANLAYQATQNAVVTAPVSGTVENLSGLVGSTVTAGTGTSVTPVLLLATAAGYSVETEVNEVDINKIHLGQDVTVTFDAIKNKTYKGHMVQVDTFGTNTQGVITYNVFNSIDNPDAQIKPNMTANLTIETNKKEGVLTVANAAVKPYKGGKAVQIQSRGGSLTYVPVMVGIKGIDRTEVLSGLTEGQKVVINGTVKAPTSALNGGGPPAN